MASHGETMMQGAQQMGDLLLGVCETALSFASRKLADGAGAVGKFAGEGMAGMPNAISDSFSPNSLGAPGESAPSKGSSPSKQISPDSPGRGPSQNFSGMLQASGFSQETLSGLNIESFNLGNTAAVGYDGVGCASYQAPRMVQTQSMMLG